MNMGGSDVPPPIPSARIQQLGDTLNHLRGVVMSCYAQVEFHLADVAVRCSSLECYVDVVPRFPRRLEERIKGVQRLAAIDGPLSPYRDLLNGTVGDIRRFTRLRDLMAHATVSIDISPTNHAVHFEMYDMVAKDRLQLVSERTTLEELSIHVERLADYADEAVALLLRIRHDLPPRISPRGPIPDP